MHLHNLAAMDQECGRFDDAERAYREALAIKETLLGPQHPEVALVANNLGTLLDQQHRHGEAVGCFRRALSIMQVDHADGHPTTVAIRRNLGNRSGSVPGPTGGATDN